MTKFPDNLATHVQFEDLWGTNPNVTHNTFYIDDVRFSALPEESPRTLTVRDDCGRSVSTDFVIHKENGMFFTINWMAILSLLLIITVFHAEIVATPVKCNAAGINTALANNGIASVELTNGQAPFSYLFQIDCFNYYCN